MPSGPDYYSHILKQRSALQEDQRLKAERAKADAALRFSQEQERNLQKRQKEELSRNLKQERVGGVISLLHEIFSQIMEHDPRIQSAPLKAIRSELNSSNTISLVWGNKFNLTSQERDWVRQHYIVTGLARWLGNPPEKIVEFDFYVITAVVEWEGRLRNISMINSIGQVVHDIDTRLDDPNYDSIPLSMFLKRPGILYPQIALALEKPDYYLRILHKNSDYWRTEEPHYDPYHGAGQY